MIKNIDLSHIEKYSWDYLEPLLNIYGLAGNRLISLFL